MAETTTVVEKDPAEYDRLVREKNAKQSQYNACESRIEELENKIARLKAKYELVAALKDTYDVNRKATRSLSKQKHQWKGVIYNNFSNHLEEVKQEDDTYYTDTVDEVLDRIILKQGELEQQLGKEKGILEGLWGAIKRLGRQIQAWGN